MAMAIIAVGGELGPHLLIAALAYATRGLLLSPSHAEVLTTVSETCVVALSLLSYMQLPSSVCCGASLQASPSIGAPPIASSSFPSCATSSPRRVISWGRFA
jgi:hypothetical protein